MTRIRYCATVWLGDRTDAVQYRGTLEFVRAKAHRRLQRYLGRAKADSLAAAGRHPDPRRLATTRALLEPFTIGVDPWGASVRHYDRLSMDDRLSGSYCITVD